MAPSMSKGIVFLLSAFLMSYLVGAANQTQRCLNSLHEIEQELSSNVPPIEGWFTNNYHNISRALFPGFNLPSLYIEVTIQFVNDTGNHTGKTISDEKPLKFTWSESCTFVSTKYIGLTAMSVYSLGTILPQRRQTQLIVTVPPLCENASRNNNFNNDNEMWRYILLTLQDIAILPNLSDPQVNTARCVVTGHEEEQGIDYPTDWYKSCWWMFAASVVTSIFVSWLMYIWTKDMKTDQWKLKSILLTVFFINTILIVTTLLPFILADLNINSIGAMILHLILVIAFFISNVVVSKCQEWKCDCKPGDCKCSKCCTIKGFYSCCRRVCMFPCIYQVVHHLMWVLCGGISSDPSWAIPVFLCECLAVFAPVCAICLYQKDTNTSGRLRIGVLLFVGVLSFVLIIGNLVMSMYGHTVTVPNAGIIEVIAVIVLVWLVKRSGLDFLGLLDKAGGNNTGTDTAGTNINEQRQGPQGNELQPLTSNQ